MPRAESQLSISSPEQWAIVTHLLELVPSAGIDPLAFTLCYLFFVNPVVIPHSKAAEQKAAREKPKISGRRAMIKMLTRGLANPSLCHVQCENEEA